MKSHSIKLAPLAMCSVALLLAGCSGSVSADSAETMAITGQAAGDTDTLPPAASTPRPATSSAARSLGAASATKPPATSTTPPASPTTISCYDEFIDWLISEGEITAAEAAELPRTETEALVVALAEESDVTVPEFCMALELLIASGSGNAAADPVSPDDEVPCLDGFIQAGVDGGHITKADVDFYPRSLFDELAMSMSNDLGLGIDQFCTFVDSGALTITSMELNLTPNS